MSASPNIHKKLHGLDHLRAIAVSSVFFFHYFIYTNGQPQWLPKLANFGWTGVDLFFVLSGFLISSQLFQQIKEGKKISFKIFFLKRFLRIVPVFWTVTGIYFIVPFFHETETLSPLWRYLTFTQNLGLDMKTNGTFSHAWSLCVEEHFYLFLPLILIFLQSSNLVRKSYWLLIALFIGGFFIRAYTYTHFYIPKSTDGDSWMYWYKYVYCPTYNRLDGLLAGVSIAAVYQFLPHTWNSVSKYGNLSLFVSLIVVYAASVLCKNPQTYYASILGFPLIALGYGLMVVGAISPNSFLYKWNSKITSFIATLSYVIYLIHKAAIHATYQLLHQYNINSNLMLLIATIGCIFGAFLLNRTIEKPFMRLRDRIIEHQ